jgi:hypothetical protein
MSNERDGKKRGPGRPPLPIDEALMQSKPDTYSRMRDLRGEDLERRRTYERLRRKRQRDARNRVNAPNAATGVDLLVQAHQRQAAGATSPAMDDIGAVNAERMKALADLRDLGTVLDRERREKAELVKALEQLRKAVAK